MKKAFLAIFSICVALILANAMAFGNPKHTSSAQPLVLVLHVDGAITAPTASYIKHGIETAEEQNATLLVIELNTPGGAGEAMLEIIQAIDNSTVPVCVYVYPRGAMAASAGMYITESAQIAAMSPQTTIGAAHPVTASGGSIQGDERAKITNTFAATVKTHAMRYGRNVKWVEEAVRKSVSATETEAVKEKIVDLEADNLRDLLNKIDGKKVNVLDQTITLHTKNALIRKIPPTAIERFLMIITHPEIVLILFMLGTYGLLYELLSPGAIFPGVVGAICLLLAFYAMGALPINYAGVFLIFLSFVLFILDLKLQAHGILTAGGLASLIFGSLLLIESGGGISKTYYMVVATIAIFNLVFVSVALKKVWVARKAPSITGKEGLIGKTGIAKTDLSPEGYIALEGTYWKARSIDGSVKAGESVFVVKVDNLLVHVKKSDER
jgi:membrane-bound serine protease (ClpP class)